MKVWGQSKRKRVEVMLNEFPVIHTNVWDAFWAIPVILLALILMKLFFFRLPTRWLLFMAKEKDKQERMMEVYQYEKKFIDRAFLAGYIYK